MGANGRRPVRVGRAQAELHPRGDVGRAPVRGAILDHGLQRIVENASRVSLPPPDVAFVEMGVNVDEQRQDYAAREREPRRLAEGADSCRRDFRYPTFVDQNVRGREPIKVDRRARGPKVGVETRAPISA